jgi:hypothetical protein
LDAFCTAHAKRQADYDLFDAVVADDAMKKGKIVLLVLAVEGVQTLRGDAQRVRDGYPDAASANVEAENAVGGAFVGHRRDYRAPTLGLGAESQIRNSFGHAEVAPKPRQVRREGFSRNLRLGLESYALPEFGSVIHRALGDDVFNVTGIVDVRERVSVDQDQVPSLALLDRPGLFFEMHGPGRDDGGGLYGFHWSESRLRIQLDFAMQAVAGDGLVGAGNDWNPCAMQRTYNRDLLVEDSVPEFGALRGRFDIGQGLRKFRSDFVDPWFEAGRRFGGGCREELKQRHGRVDHGVMIFEK